jgi:hypothetical protein
MLQPTLLGIALLLGGLGYYYYGYVPGREAVQTERLFRQLDEMSDQMVSKLDLLTNCLHTAASAAITEAATTPGMLPVTVPPTAFRTGVESFVPRLSISPEFSINTADGKTSIPLQKRSVTLQVEQRARIHPVVCTVRLTTQQIQLTARVTTSLRGLMEPITSRHEFHDLLLVDSEGMALSLLTNGIPNLEQLPRLLTAGTQGVNSAATNPVVLSNLVTAIRARAILAGKPHSLFLQPLPLQLNIGEEISPRSRWFLAGVTEERELAQRARPLPYSVVFGFAAAVVLLAILLPFLNILTAGNHSTLKSYHVVFLISATLAGSGGLAIASLHVSEYWHQESQLDGKLADLAADIEQDFHSEVTNTVEWLGRFNGDAIHSASLDVTNRLTLFRPDSPTLRPPAGLRIVQWIQADGRQAVKWSVSSNMTPLIWVGDRPYVQEILSRRGYPVDLPSAEFGTTRRFHLLPIYSRLRAENVLACSIAAPAPVVAGRSNLAVVCAEFEPQSLMRALLPAGYQFAVVDREGLVQFHSDIRRNLRENLLVECDGNPRLQAALEARSADEFAGDYYQRRHRLHVTPLPGLPWTLVVLRDHRLLDAIRTSQVTTLLSVLAAAALVIVAVLWMATGVGHLIRGRSAGLPRWFWPNQACLPSYRISSRIHATILALVVLLTLTQFTLSRHPGIFLFLFGLGPLAAAVSCLLLRWATDRSPSGRNTLVSAADQRLYVSWLATTLVVLVIPSSLLVHRVIAEIESERFVRWTNSGLSDALRARLLEQVEPNQFLEGTRAGQYPSVFQDSEWSWIPDSGTPAHPAPDPDTRFHSLLQILRGSIVDPDQPGSRMHGWGVPMAADGSWWSTRIGDHLVFEHRLWHPDAGAGTTRISSRLLTFPSLGQADRWGAFSLLGILLGLLAAWIAAHFIAVRVLLLRQTADDAAPLPSLVALQTQPPSAGLPTEVTAEEESVSRLVHRESARTHWNDGTAPIVGPVPRGSILILDWRQRTDSPSHETVQHWIRQATENDCQVILLSTAPTVIQSLRQRGATIVVAGTPVPPGKQALDKVLDLLAAEYERRWTVCTPAERRALQEMASTGFEDANNPAVASLLHRGWLRLDPNLRIPGGSWRRHVLSLPPVETPSAEGGSSDSQWKWIRTLLVVAALGIMAFLMLTQPDTWQRTTGVIAGLLAGIKLMGDFLGTVRKEAGAADTK